MSDASLFPEDYERLVKMSSGEGPCWQISHLARFVLKGMLSKVVSRLNDGCKQILEDGWDYSDCGYEFRNGFECACWLKHDCEQGHLFGPKLDIDEEVESAVRYVLVSESERLVRIRAERTLRVSVPPCENTDSIVYKLYGLTDDEIAVVEKAVKK